MNIRRTISSSLVAIGVLGTTLLALAPAHAGTAAGHRTEGTQYGSILRAKLTDNADGSGYTFKSYGSGNCSPETTNIDFAISDLANYGWDNDPARAYDYASCDTKLFLNSAFSSPLTGWMNFGSGAPLGGAAEKASSFQLS